MASNDASLSYGTVTQAEAAHVPDNDDKKFFPLHPSKLIGRCSPVLAALMPSYFATIQNLSHLALVVGTISTLVLIIRTGIDIGYEVNRHAPNEDPKASQKGDKSASNYVLLSIASAAYEGGLGRFLAILFCSSSLIYFIFTLPHFSADILSRKEAIRKQQEQNDKQYKDMLSELEGHLSKSLDTQAMLAERSLESKRRDAAKFFQFIKLKLATGTELHDMFRAFVVLWLRIFSECSTAPTTEPFLVLPDEEVSTSLNAPDLASLLEIRLKKVQIKFYSQQVEKEKENISVWRKTKKFSSKVKRFVLHVTKIKENEKDLEQGDAEADPKTLLHNKEKSKEPFRWLIFGKVGFHFTPEEDDDGLPLSIGFGFGRLTLLSLEHILLLFSSFIGLHILAFEVLLTDRFKFLLLSQLVTCLICNCFILYEFQDIDAAGQLEGELREIQSAKAELEERRAKVMDFHKSAQLLSELWLRVTIPRLELMKHCGEHLEDINDDTEGTKRLTMLKDVVPKLQSLDNSLPALERWQRDDGLKAEMKTAIGEALIDLSREASLDSSLPGLPEAVRLLELLKKKLEV
jgi:hypothetical protein